jgi:hypothetical protein
MALKISLVLLFVLLLSKSLFVDSSPMLKRDDDDFGRKCGITKNSSTNNFIIISTFIYMSNYQNAN